MTEPIAVHTSTYLTFTEYENYMRIEITQEGRERVAEIADRELGDDLVFLDLCEGFTGNEWHTPTVAQLGDMRNDNDITLTRDYTYGDENDDDILLVGKAFYYGMSNVYSYTQHLLEDGYVDWTAHRYLSQEDMDSLYTMYRPDNHEGDYDSYYVETAKVNYTFSYTQKGKVAMLAQVGEDTKEGDVKVSLVKGSDTTYICTFPQQQR